MKTTLATIRKHTKSPLTIDLGKNGNDPVFYYFGELLPEQNCEDIGPSIKHTGWFTNEYGVTCRDGSGIVRGIVVTLPIRPGFPDGVFLAGYLWGDNGGRVLWPDCFAESIEAARYADGYAKSFADDLREHDAKWDAAQKLETKIEDSLQRLRECLSLRNNPCFSTLRAEALQLLETIRETRETLRTDYAGVL